MSSGVLTRGGSRPARPATDVSPLIDPRLQARRVEVARARGRRRLRWLTALVVVVVLGVAAFAATRSALLDVDHIGVQGAAPGQRAEARAAAGVSLGSPLVSVQPTSVATAIERLPWVDSASVVRRWPGTLEIRVTARVPIAVVGAGAAAVGVDRVGRSIGPAPAGTTLPVLGLPAVPTGRTVPASWRPALTVIAGLPADLRTEVTEGRVDREGIELVLRDGIQVRFGDASRLRAKGVALRALLDRAGRSSIDGIDLRVPAAPSLTRRPGGGA